MSFFFLISNGFFIRHFNQTLHIRSALSLNRFFLNTYEDLLLCFGHFNNMLLFQTTIFFYIIYAFGEKHFLSVYIYIHIKMFFQ